MTTKSNTKALSLTVRGAKQDVSIVASAPNILSSSNVEPKIERNLLLRVARSVATFDNENAVEITYNGESVIARLNGNGWLIEHDGKKLVHPRAGTKKANRKDELDNGPDVVSLTSFIMREVYGLSLGLRQTKKTLSPEQQEAIDKYQAALATAKAAREAMYKATGKKPRSQPVPNPEKSRAASREARMAAHNRRG